MRGVAVAALLTVASCSNLQTSMEGMLKTIEGVKFTGKGRASGAAEARVDQVSQFLREMKENNKIAPASMDQILTLINNLFPGYVTERDDDQAILNAYEQDWADCMNLTSRGLAEDKWDEAKEKRSAHDLCRNQERALYATDDTACTNLFSSLDSKRAVGCEDFPAVSRNNGDAWEVAVNAIDGWFEEMTVFVSSNFPSCEDSGSDWADKKEECDNNRQVAFETTACVGCGMREAMCADETQCYDNLEIDYANSASHVFDAAAVRISQVAVLKFLVCVIGQVKDAADEATMVWDTINAACQDQLAASNWVSFNNTEIVFEAREECETKPWRCPSWHLWREREYETDHGNNNHGIAHQATSPVPVLTSC